MGVDKDALNTLTEEHLLLGGVLEEREGVAVPLSYESTPIAEEEALENACGVTDVSCMHFILISGENASSLFEAAWAGKVLSVGECAFGAVLAGDGSIVAVPCALRTGDHEYILCDATSRWEALKEWLIWLSNLVVEEQTPFSGAHVSDVTGSLVPLLVTGPKANTILEDYLHDGEKLPSQGSVASLHLDKILTICAHIHQSNAFLLLIPPAYSRIMWRSLLSFTEMQPVGIRALTQFVQTMLPWMEPISDNTKHVAFSKQELEQWGIARHNGGYIGARALV